MTQTILIVDDSATIRQMVGFCLRDAGYQVIEAVDGKDALDKLKKQKINLLLTDLYMPLMDGIELAKQVRALVQYRCMPILVLTTEAQTTKKSEGQAAGVSGWFVKPFEPTQLIKVIKRLIN
jgi:two-component system, chemotaxis family, chemotaxis protein CheY